MATRRSGEARFDHGAQFFTVRSPEFRREVNGWLDAGVTERWANGFARKLGSPKDGDGHPRYRGAPAMTSIAKHMSQGLDIRLSSRVAAVKLFSRGEGPGIEVRTETETIDAEETLTARTLILTPPVPQSRVLLEAGGLSLPDELGGIVYDQCLVLLAVDPKVQLPVPGALQRPSATIDWRELRSRLADGSLCRRLQCPTLRRPRPRGR
ncbi:MAG: hypothetical protein GVY29_12445 [Spirochaetes bacterium]|jgi:predicted NAD/FAD-dependent oxidoreductase|nr:hypothetical protein [Spirochaetota bacterium]